MDFVAIDFETANRYRDSACALGLVLVENGEVTDQRSWLIRPYDNEFEPYHTRLHGIDADMVLNQPEFYELWPAIQPFLEGRMVVAHNASFDMSVLRHVLDKYNLSYPELTYACSVKISREVWARPSYKLSALCKWLEIDLTHHEALSDANGCAQIVLEAAAEMEVWDLPYMLAELKLSSGRLFDGGYFSSTKPKRKNSYRGYFHR
ncbi:MAG: 3'-5' exonuclease [Bacteroidota bacterium]